MAMRFSAYIRRFCGLLLEMWNTLCKLCLHEY